MRPPERGHAMRVGPGIWGCVLVLAMLAGCSRLSFVKPDVRRGSLERTGPEPAVLANDSGNEIAAARLAIQRGQAAFTAGRIDEAADLAAQSVDLAPESAAAHTLQAVVADRMNRTELAGEHYRRAVELAPRSGGMQNNYGTWLCANGREAESLPWFDRALTAPGYRTPAAAMANAGACALRAGEQARAQRYLEAALELAPDNPVALAAMARHEFEAGRAFHARAFSQRRLAAAPADAASLLLASQIEKKLGDMDAANRYVQRLRAEFPAASGSGSGDGR